MGNRTKNTNLQWRIALCLGAGGLGGIIVDFDHILNASTGIVPWAEFHTLTVFLFLCGLFIASIGGLFLSLVLRSKL